MVEKQRFIRDFGAKNKTKSFTIGEIKLERSLTLLIKYKYIIMLCTLVPAVLFLAFQYLFTPQTYSTSLEYINVVLQEKEFYIVQNQFYSPENVKRITNAIKQKGDPTHITKVLLEEEANFKTHVALDPFVLFSQTNNAPHDTSQSHIRLTVNGHSKEEVALLLEVCKSNFENTLPLYYMQYTFNSEAMAINSRMNNYIKELSSNNIKLASMRNLLDKLETIDSSSDNLNKIAASGDNNINLNYHTSDDSWVPLKFQIESLKTKIATLEEDISKAEKMYQFDLKIKIIVEKTMNQWINPSADFNVQKLITFFEQQQEDADLQIKDFCASQKLNLASIEGNWKPLIASPTIKKTPKNILKPTISIAFVGFLLSFFFCSEIDRHKFQKSLQRSA